MDTPTRRTDRNATPSVAVAFYGRTNQRSPHDPTKSAQQYRLCLDTVAGRAAISHFYDYDDTLTRCATETADRNGATDKRTTSCPDLFRDRTGERRQ